MDYINNDQDSLQPSSGSCITSQDVSHSLINYNYSDQITIATNGHLHDQDSPFSLATHIMPQPQANNDTLRNINGSEAETNLLRILPQQFCETAYYDYLSHEVSQHSENPEPLNTFDFSPEQSNTERQLFTNASIMTQVVNGSWYHVPDVSDGTVSYNPQIETPVFSGLDAVGPNELDSVLDPTTQNTVFTIGNDSLASLGAHDQIFYLDGTVQADFSWPTDFNMSEDFSATSRAETMLFNTVDPETSIRGEINSQRTTKSSASESSYESPFNSIPPSHGVNDFTKYNEFGAVSSSTGHDIGSTPLVSNNIAGVAFGPSRPVSLPPARKGGKKGPLSLKELEKRREARRQGVCIRCRNIKEKVLRA
jgi:hypothetical protein